MFSRSDGAIVIAGVTLAALYIGLSGLVSPAPREWVSAIENFSAQDLDLPLDINRASISKLQELPGIGPVLAERIVRYRLEHGPFRSLDQLLEIPGIGPQTLEKLRPQVQTCFLAPCD